MANEIDYHSWRPSVLKAKYPAQNDEYVGNIIIGVNRTKTEVLALIDTLSMDLIGQVGETGDEKIEEVNSYLEKYIGISEIVSGVSDALIEEIRQMDIEIPTGLFYLNSSALNSDLLG